MKAAPLVLWQRALKAHQSSQRLLPDDPDSAASRAYYAAFYAASALFAREDISFSKHTALRSAVHRDLVHAGRWPKERGLDYQRLSESRETADYGGEEHVSLQEARKDVAAAGRILLAVHQSQPDDFPLPENFTAEG